MNETTNAETGGERAECLMGAAAYGADVLNPSDVGREPCACGATGEDAYLSVAGASVGQDELRGGPRVVMMKDRIPGMKPRSLGGSTMALSYLSILTL